MQFIEKALDQDFAAYHINEKNICNRILFYDHHLAQPRTKRLFNMYGVLVLLNR